MSQEFDDYFAEVEKQNAGNEYVTVHCRRYAMSMDWIAADMPMVKNVLEVGGPCPFSKALKHFFPHLEIEQTAPADLRTIFTNKRNHYDFILNMEVIEHINDLEINDTLHRESYAGDGLANFVQTCYLALKPGGKMFLTTPNLSSYGSIWKMLLAWHPHSYHLHVHELAMNELFGKLCHAGFKIARYETKDCYEGDRVPGHVVEALQRLLTDLSCPTEYRAAVQFVLAFKPA